MSKRSRTHEEQKAHDSEVFSEADEYETKEYKVWAEVDEFPKPRTYHGKTPDVVAKKDGHKTLVEIETESSKDTKRAKNQHNQFKSWASKKSNRHFRQIIIQGNENKK